MWREWRLEAVEMDGTRIDQILANRAQPDSAAN